jgi:hypothetical protein
MMNWDAIGAVGEVAGAAGVIITLVYLAIQIRQNTKAIRLNTIRSTNEGFRSQAALIGGSNEVAEVYTNGLMEPEKLNLTERVQFYALLHNQVRGYEEAFYQHTEGALDPRIWAGMHGQMLNTSTLPGFKVYWQDRRDWYSSSFQNQVENVLYPNAKPFVIGGSKGAN